MNKEDDECYPHWDDYWIKGYNSAGKRWISVQPDFPSPQAEKAYEQGYSVGLFKLGMGTYSQKDNIKNGG